MCSYCGSAFGSTHTLTIITREPWASRAVNYGRVIRSNNSSPRPWLTADGTDKAALNNVCVSDPGAEKMALGRVLVRWYFSLFLVWRKRRFSWRQWSFFKIEVTVFKVPDLWFYFYFWYHRIYEGKYIIIKHELMIIAIMRSWISMPLNVECKSYNIFLITMFDVPILMFKNSQKSGCKKHKNEKGLSYREMCFYSA